MMNSSSFHEPTNNRTAFALTYVPHCPLSPLYVGFIVWTAEHRIAYLMPDIISRRKRSSCIHYYLSFVRTHQHSISIRVPETKLYMYNICMLLDGQKSECVRWTCSIYHSHWVVLLAAVFLIGNFDDGFSRTPACAQLKCYWAWFDEATLCA